jgi:glycine cleavage system aminomethyltransferase T
LSLFLNDKAGIIDDCIATILPQDETVRIVVNGANKYIVMKHLNELVEREKLMTRVELFDDNGLIAVQGPKSPAILQ